MAAISERPRLGAAILAAVLITAGCSLVKPEEPAAVSGQQRVQRLAADGKHAEAARGYADLAAQNPSDHDN